MKFEQFLCCSIKEIIYIGDLTKYSYRTLLVSHSYVLFIKLLFVNEREAGLRFKVGNWPADWLTSDYLELNYIVLYYLHQRRVFHTQLIGKSVIGAGHFYTGSILVLSATALLIDTNFSQKNEVIIFNPRIKYSWYIPSIILFFITHFSHFSFHLLYFSPRCSLAAEILLFSVFFQSSYFKYQPICFSISPLILIRSLLIISALSLLFSAGWINFGFLIEPVEKYG